MRDEGRSRFAQRIRPQPLKAALSVVHAAPGLGGALCAFLVLARQSERWKLCGERVISAAPGRGAPVHLEEVGELVAQEIAEDLCGRRGGGRRAVRRAAMKAACRRGEALGGVDEGSKAERA